MNHHHIRFWPTGKEDVRYVVVPRSPKGWLFRIPTNDSVTITAETLAGAELYAMARDGLAALTIYYGPPETP